MFISECRLFKITRPIQKNEVEFKSKSKSKSEFKSNVQSIDKMIEKLNCLLKEIKIE
jgi:hypothetical protein